MLRSTGKNGENQRVTVGGEDVPLGGRHNHYRFLMLSPAISTSFPLRRTMHGVLVCMAISRARSAARLIARSAPSRSGVLGWGLLVVLMFLSSR